MYLKIKDHTYNLDMNTICFGIDPDPEKILNPSSLPDEAQAVEFYFLSIIDGLAERQLLPKSIKPNFAHFEALGISGLQAMQKIIKKAKELSLPVILDAKRCDIGSTAEKYAKAAFEVWEADAVTVVPYLGQDGIAPFTAYCPKGKSVFIVCKSSNPSSGEIQDVATKAGPLSHYILDRIKYDWYRKNIGVVIGTTDIHAFKDHINKIINFPENIPLLLPGGGTQGGDTKACLKHLKQINYDLNKCHFVRARDIAYAYQKERTPNFVEAACRAMQKAINETSL